MGSQRPGDPSLSAGRRLGAAKARQYKSARAGVASVTRISAGELLPEGDPPPALTDEEVEGFHPTVVGLYNALTESAEAAHFRRADWFAVKIIMLMVSGHLHEAAGVEIEDADGNVKRVGRNVKVGVLAEVNRALESINATPAGRTQYALALAALAKATGAGQPDPEQEERQREISAEKATQELLKHLRDAG